SVLSQEGVDAEFSGAAAADAAGGLTIEGVGGSGEDFMLGSSRPTALPDAVNADVEAAYERARAQLGPARFEWVHDGAEVWVVQLHRGPLPGYGRTIYPGEPSHEHHFEVERGLEELRALVAHVQGSEDGIVLIGSVGVTSHFGDVLRKARVPSRIETP